MNVISNVYIDRVVLEASKLRCNKEVLVVGAGDCATCYHLIKAGFDVISTDYKKTERFEQNMVDYKHLLNWQESSILDINSFSVESRDIVVCMEVLEHLVDYKLAFENLLKLTNKRLIIGVPWKTSFNYPAPPPEGHCNYWDYDGRDGYKNIYEFEEMCKPHKFYIENIISHEEDLTSGERVMLMIIDKEIE